MPHEIARRLAVIVAATAVAGLAPAGVAAASLTGVAATGGGRVVLPSPVPGWIAGLTDAGPASATTAMSIRVYLAGRSPAAETRFAVRASTPGNPAYGRYLTPGRFLARFGPNKAAAAAVEAWARSAGLTVADTTGHYVALTGTAPQVSAALGTSIDSYDLTFKNFTIPAGYAPASGMSVPESIARDVATVTGLDSESTTGAQNAAAAARSAIAGAKAAMAPSRPAAPSATPAAPPTAFTCSHWWGQHVSAIPAADGRTSAPDAVCGYTPRQLRSAYGVGLDSGKGATIAVVLDGSLSSMRADANRFFAAHHVPGFAPGQFTVNTPPGLVSSCGSPSGDVPEEPLDVETLHILAPAARIVYVAADCTGADNQMGLLDAETRVVDKHLADVVTESYSVLESQFSPAVAAAWTQVFKQGAAEGIGFDFDSGDGGNDTNGSLTVSPQVTFPASDPWATAVGGTTLEIGRRGRVVGELGWGDNGAQENSSGTGYLQPPPGVFEEGSTGGRSTLFPQPAYQRGAVPPALATSDHTLPAGREVPDVAADASPITGWRIGYTTPGGEYSQYLEGGTSGASPIVAALEADAKQAVGHAIGFANPLLYDMRHSAGIRDIVPAPRPALALGPNCYADPTQPGPACVFTLGPDTSLTEAPGYDDATGLGAVTSQFVFTAARLAR